MYLQEHKLNKKTALVTGAGKGIGKACAIALAEAGADLILVSRTKKDLLAVQKTIKKLKRKCTSFVCDISNYDETKKLFSQIKKLDILVNNAGTNIPEYFTKIKLHMVGRLQTNKVKYVIPLFDYIHSLDNLKLAEKISNEQIKKNKIIKLFIQVNISNEKQKNGVLIEELGNFYSKCTKDLGLNIIGLMCLPPNDNKSSIYFSKMYQLVKKLQLKEISMGMSSDYLEAINYQSTYLRIGSKIFGERNQ